MYVLSQSGRIANQDLQKHLAKYEYYPIKRTPRLWEHRARPISFTLVVYNFGIKYTNKNDIDDLYKAIKDKYLLKIDWSGTKYVRINPDWVYDKQEVKLFMLKYVKRLLKQFQQPTPTNHHYGSTKYLPQEYKKLLYGTHCTSPKLTQLQKNHKHKVCRIFLYDRGSVDNT